MNTRLVVALLLLNLLGNPAAAAETPEHQSKHARQLLAALSAAGINHPDIKEFVSNVDSHIDDGYLTFAERDVPGGKLKVRYQLNPSYILGTQSGAMSKRVELNYAPDNSNWEATVGVDRALVTYRVKF